jgi:hypothetical protein
MLDRPLQPVYPGFEDMWQTGLIDSCENFNDRIQEVFPDLTNVIQSFSFNISQEEENTRGQVWAVSQMRQVFGS